MDRQPELGAGVRQAVVRFAVDMDLSCQRRQRGEVILLRPSVDPWQTITGRDGAGRTLAQRLCWVASEGISLSASLSAIVAIEHHMTSPRQLLRLLYALRSSTCRHNSSFQPSNFLRDSGHIFQKEVAKCRGIVSLCHDKHFSNAELTILRSTEELVCASQRGDSDSFNELVLRYERAAWTTAWKILRDHHGALDATQNAFVEAYCKLSQLRVPSQFGIWLLRIAHREALRLAMRSPSAIALDQTTDVAITTIDGTTADYQSLMNAVANLPEHERLVVVLRYFNGHSIEEVSELTGRPLGTVSKQLSRAMIRLKSLVLVEESL